MKRKIELQTLDGLKTKVESDESLNPIEALVDECLQMNIRDLIQSALQQAYDQGYEDAKPKWLPIDSAPTYVEVLIGGHDDYDGVTLASRNSDGEFSTDDGFSLSNPRCWMPLPEIEE